MTTKTIKPRVEVMFRACADRTRLRILQLLLQGELCVCDLVNVIDAPQPTISRHLAYLRRAGLVVVRKEGLWCHYRLAPADSAFHDKLLKCLAACANEVPGAKGDAKRLQTCERGGCCD